MTTQPTVAPMAVRNVEVYVQDLEHDETFSIVPDRRHNVDGYRVLRHTYRGQMLRCMDGTTDKIYDWDEQYMFFPDVVTAMQAILSRDFEKGRQAF